MLFNPHIHHRHSIRLKGYDYSQAGLYFTTICVQNRECLFWDIADKNMRLNDAGQMIVRWYRELEHKFPDIQCDDFICMPNHIHFIVRIVGADTQVCPYDTVAVCPYDTVTVCPDAVDPNGNRGEHIGSPLSVIVQWFKTMTTNEYIRGVKSYNWQRFDKRLWQRNYYEHIIRNEQEYYRIVQYIIGNPAKWEQDKFNAGTGNTTQEIADGTTV